MSAIQYYAGMKPEPLGMCSEKPSFLPPLQELINQVKSKVNIPTEQLNDIHLIPISTSVSGPILGRTHSGAYVFIPDYFNANSINDLRADRLSKMIKQCYNVEVKKEDWTSGTGQMLVKSFILSDRAKKFFISHQLYSAEYSPFLMKPAILMLNISMYFFIVDRLMNGLGVQASKLSAGKFLLVTLPPAMLLLLGWCLYNALYIDKIHWMDSDARAITQGALGISEIDKMANALDDAQITGKPYDSKLIEQTNAIDIDMVEGAIEYYSKLITRHLALKDISKKNEKWYESTNRRFTYEGKFKGTGWKIRFIPSPHESLSKIRSWVSFVLKD